jgi:hypothetical protein
VAGEGRTATTAAAPLTTTSVPTSASDAQAPTDGRRVRIRPRYRSWAELVRRAFDTDVLACPKRGGRMVLLATIEDPAVIRRILTHLGLSLDGGEPLPGQPPP